METYDNFFWCVLYIMDINFFFSLFFFIESNKNCLGTVDSILNARTNLYTFNVFPILFLSVYLCETWRSLFRRPRPMRQFYTFLFSTHAFPCRLSSFSRKIYNFATVKSTPFNRRSAQISPSAFFLCVSFPKCIWYFEIWKIKKLSTRFSGI